MYDKIINNLVYDKINTGLSNHLAVRILAFESLCIYTYDNFLNYLKSNVPTEINSIPIADSFSFDIFFLCKYLAFLCKYLIFNNLIQNLSSHIYNNSEIFYGIKILHFCHIFYHFLCTIYIINKIHFQF